MCKDQGFVCAEGKVNIHPETRDNCATYLFNYIIRR